MVFIFYHLNCSFQLLRVDLIFRLYAITFEAFQVITCEEKARVDSFCPKHGVCHPRLELMMSIRVILMIMMYQLLRGLGGAWKRKSLQVTKFPQCKVRRGKIKFWRGEIKARRGEIKVRRGKIKAQTNKKTKPSSSTQVQAEVIQRCF